MAWKTNWSSEFRQLSHLLLFISTMFLITKHHNSFITQTHHLDHVLNWRQSQLDMAWKQLGAIHFIHVHCKASQFQNQLRQLDHPCWNLQFIKVSDGNEHYYSDINGIVYDIGFNSIIFYSAGMQTHLLQLVKLHFDNVLH